MSDPLVSDDLWAAIAPLLPDHGSRTATAWVAVVGGATSRSAKLAIRSW